MDIGIVVAAAVWAGFAARNNKGERPVAKPMKPRYNAGRNELCPCQSGKKFKRCCHNKAA